MYPTLCLTIMTPCAMHLAPDMSCDHDPPIKSVGAISASVYFHVVLKRVNLGSYKICIRFKCLNCNLS